MLDHSRWVGWIACAAVAVGCGLSGIPTREAADQSGGSGAQTSTTSSGGGAGAPSNGETFVGQSCTTDAECGDHPGSRCVGPSDSEPIFTTFWLGGDSGAGVAGGYCTRDCEFEACPDGSRCSGSVCLATCDYGSPELPQLDSPLAQDKCHGRDDLMCVATDGGGAAVCMPNCGSDAACGGRLCDTRMGVCTDPARQGLPNGAPCVLDNENTPVDEDACAGLCIAVVDEDDVAIGGICSGRCSLGGDLDSNDCGGPGDGLCAIPSSHEDAGDAQLGDLGFCAASCGAHDQCNYQANVFCMNLGSEMAGYCVSARPCPLHNECDAPQVCTETAVGFMCLDDDGTGSATLYPLGNAGPL